MNVDQAEIELGALSAWNASRYGAPAVDTVHPMFLEAFALGYRARAKGGSAWISTKEAMPPINSYIVKRWRQGTVWAGLYTGTTKEGSFDEWLLLPMGGQLK